MLLIDSNYIVAVWMAKQLNNAVTCPEYFENMELNLNEICRIFTRGEDNFRIGLYAI
jgi:hypothetical protein